MPKFDLDNTPNAKMIKSVQEKSITQANAKTVQDIPLELIDENPDNSEIFNMEKIQKLAENIKLEGFFGTIELYRKEDGRYEISSGHRRYRAVKMLGYKTIPATVSQMPELDTQKRRKLIASNINSRNMKPLDWARAINYYAETLMIEDAQARGVKYVPGQKYKASNNLNINQETAKYFDMKEVTIIRYRALCRLIPELREMVEDETLPWTSIAEVGNMEGEQQNDILKEINKAILVTPPVETETVDEKGKPIEKVFLSGVQVSNIVRKYKQNLSAEERKAKEQPSEQPVDNVSPEDSIESTFTPLDFSMDLPTISEDTPVSESTNRYIRSIDNLMFTIEKEFSLLLNQEYVVDDKQAVKEKIESLENILAELKKKL
jgi:ParB family chromosome partitioning protein